MEFTFIYLLSSRLLSGHILSGQIILLIFKSECPQVNLVTQLSTHKLAPYVHVLYALVSFLEIVFSLMV